MENNFDSKYVISCMYTYVDEIGSYCATCAATLVVDFIINSGN